MAHPRRIGKYELLEEIGHGGFAVVYKARDTRLDRVVALKVMHPYRMTGDSTFVARFRQEARTAANLRHPNIVTVHDADEVEGWLYIAMEYLPGRTLEAVLKAEDVLSLERALSILAQMADALDEAHAQGVVHRDIKPSNVMVEEIERGLQVTLMDFGLVRALESSTAFTQEGSLLGTPEYMAPEQAEPERAGEIGPAADLYALGVVAYQMLTGRVPFPGNTLATLNAHVHSAPPDPRHIRRSLPADVGAILLKMLAKAPGERFGSACAFVEALGQAAEADRRARELEAKLSALYERLKAADARGEWGALFPSLPGWMWVILGVLAVVVVGGMCAVGTTYLPGLMSAPISPTSVAKIAPTVTSSAITVVPTVTSPPMATPRPPAETSTSTPTFTLTPRPAMATPTNTPVLETGDTMMREIDGMVMVYVPVGEFLMGSSDTDSRAGDDEKPQHKVSLDAFWIDQTEVTNKQYKLCVAVGECDAPAYADNVDYNGDDQPVVGVDWYSAKKYCKWLGGALPTEAQWEYAARGSDGRIYPWGNQAATCEYAVMYEGGPGCGKGTTWPVGSKPKGTSPYGALDMAGSVGEWVADWYASDYYANSPAENPQGPETGSSRLLRGGSFHDYLGDLRVTYRYGHNPAYRNNDVGFRCARSPGQ